MRAQSRFIIQIRNFWSKAGLLVLLALIAPSIAEAAALATVVSIGLTLKNLKP